MPALQAVKHLIRQPDEEKQYGPDKRQMLDVYYPPELEKGKKYPVFMFYYGGEHQLLLSGSRYKLTRYRWHRRRRQEWRCACT